MGSGRAPAASCGNFRPVLFLALKAAGRNEGVLLGSTLSQETCKECSSACLGFVAKRINAPATILIGCQTAAKVTTCPCCWPLPVHTAGSASINPALSNVQRRQQHRCHCFVPSSHHKAPMQLLYSIYRARLANRLHVDEPQRGGSRHQRC